MKGQMSLHIRAISPQPLLFALKKKRCRWRLRPNFKGQFMRVWYLLHMRAMKDQMSLHIRAISPQPLLFALKKKRCRWRFRPTFVPFKVVVLVLLIHDLMFPHWIDGAPCLMRVFYALLSVLLCFAIIMSRKRESMITCLHCLPTISVLWLLLTVPWVCLRCVIVVLSGHTRLIFIGQFIWVWCLSRNWAEKDQTRWHICALSPHQSLRK